MHTRLGREGNGKWRQLVLEDVIFDEEKILLPVVTGLKGLLNSLNQARCGLARGLGAILPLLNRKICKSVKMTVAYFYNFILPD